MSSIIENIQKEFLLEAQSSPMLMSDLAHMETYIAESYHSRSVIELLQNADDAESNRFYIGETEKGIVVANDGRFFSEEDVVSICRSGASTKKRDGKSIGYRGIGFKSVVNLAERVHIISNNIKMTFSRELTNQVINSNIPVPLIRIPHNYTPLFNHNETISDLIENNFKTIFIFENINPNNLGGEIESFDSSSLLFLRNIKQVEFETSLSKLINIKRKSKDFKEYLTISNDGLKEEWLVIRDGISTDKTSTISFLLDNQKKIVPLDTDRAVVHSFMPTKDNVGLPLKINGDFSTDPSRTKVVNDELSKKSLKNCSNLIVDIVGECLLGNEDEVFTGLFEVLNTAENNIISRFSSTVKIKDELIDSITEQLKTNKWFNNKSTDQIRFNPDWLNIEDFKEFCKIMNFVPLDKSFESKYPGILKFAEKFGVKPISVEELLDATIENTPSLNGSTEIIRECIRKYRFNLQENAKNKIKKANIIYFKDGVKSLTNASKTEKFNDEFLSLLRKTLDDFQDFKWFLNQFCPSLTTTIFEDDKIEEGKFNNALSSKNYNIDKMVVFNQNNDTKILFNSKEHQSLSTQTEDTVQEYSPQKKINISASISKWRSAETNLAAFIETSDDVKKVIDVSKSNLGYDLEVHKFDGIEYVEVKSVDKLGSTISLTNNEYSTANELKDKYIIAIVRQTKEGLDVCYITNPIAALDLTKRVTRWEWICDEYSGEYSNYYFE